jgi:hypothetical protein
VEPALVLVVAAATAAAAEAVVLGVIMNVEGVLVTKEVLPLGVRETMEHVGSVVCNSRALMDAAPTLRVARKR